MRPAAKLDAERLVAADAYHADLVAVLLVEKRERATLDGVVVRHLVHVYRFARRYFLINRRFDRLELRRRQRARVRKIETQTARIDERSGLLHAVAQRFTK